MPSLAALTEYVVLAALRDWSEIADAGVRLRVAVNANLGVAHDRSTWRR